MNPHHKSYMGMPYALKQFADVKFYGPSFPNCVTRQELLRGAYIDVPHVIKKLYGNDYPDVIIQSNPLYSVWSDGGEGLWPFLRNFHLARCLRVMWLHDTHHLADALIKYLKEDKVDLIIKYVDAKNQAPWSRDVERTGVPTEWCPFSIDPKLFYDRNLAKIYDVTNIGMKTGYYPLRILISRVLGSQAKIKYYRGGACYGGVYAVAINQTKIFATGTSIFTVPTQKMFEIMACNTLLMCNTAIDAEELGFEPNVNFALIDYNPELRSTPKGWMATKEPSVEAFMEPIKYYLSNPEEAKKIAQRGHDLVHSRHTHEIRMENFVHKLSKHL